jgi:diguanylate cyclase (GGDEF)-like protein
MTPQERTAERSTSKPHWFLRAFRPSPAADRTLHPSLVATYRLRSVALGGLISALWLTGVVIYMALSSGEDAQGFFAVVLASAVLLLGVVLTPWNRVLVAKQALRALYTWSILQLFVIGAAVYFDGGANSSLYVMFFVMAVYFAVAYPMRAQLVLLGITAATYAVAVSFGDDDILVGALFIRFGSLALLSFVASIVSGWLVAEMRDRARSLSAADQRAGMLDTVARAARRVSSLDASHVLGGALSGAMELGCAEAEIWMLEGDPKNLVLQRRIAIEQNSPNERLAYEIFRAARVAGATQMLEIGTECIVGCLLQSEGDPAGLLLTKMHVAVATDSLIVECIELLAAQASAGLEVARNVSERRGLEERLAHWAFHDSLTDLPNRVLFADRLELALARTARDDTQVAVLFLDLDGFKEINDTFGHAAGDELLQNVARRLHGCLRPNDTLARYGGDEFVVLVEQVDSAGSAILVAKRILNALSHPVRVGDQQLYVKTSIGIALAGAQPGANTDVLRRADMAMYEAKTSGGSRYVLAPTADHASRNGSDDLD